MMRLHNRAEFVGDVLEIKGIVLLYCWGSDVDTELVVLTGANDAMRTHIIINNHWPSKRLI